MPYTLITPDDRITEAPRVTEVIRAVLARPALHEWELGELAKWCQRCQPSTEAARTVETFRRTNRQAADRGTAVHAWIAAILTDQPLSAVPASAKGHCLAFTNWLGDDVDALTPIAVEQTLTTPAFDVAGTADLIATTDGGVRTVIDWKTVTRLTERPYTDQLAQLAAYGSMTRAVHGAAKRISDVPVPACSAARIVQLAPDGRYREHVVVGSLFERARWLWHEIMNLHRVLRLVEHEIANEGERERKATCP